MTIDEVKQILQNKVSNLLFQRGEAEKAGRLDDVVKLASEIAETEATISNMIR